MASRIGRRDFLAGLVVTVAVSPLGCSSDDDGGGQKPITYSTDPADQAAVYPQGIASGDPKPDSVILWTRALPKAGSGSVNVIYEIASDEAFETVIATGSVDVDETTDWTVRIKPTGLSPYTAYHYRFKAEQTQSVNGRTKTAPAADQDVPVRFAFASCQDFVGRYYHSWKAFLSEAPVDFVVWLGDYIYETDGDPDFQTVAPDRTITIPDGIEIAPKVKAAKSLEDYRGLYRQYRSDEHLQKVHASYPFIIIWDDHEFANDSWADHATDFNDKKGDEKSTARRENANQAWFEYQPADVTFDANQAFPDDLVIYRTLRYGKHVELFMTDQRSYRDDHCIPEGGKTSDKPAGAPAGMPTYDEAGKLSANSSLGSRNFCKKEAFDKIEAFVKPKVLGDKQKQWFVDGMKASTASWKFWGNETQLLQMTVDLTLPAVPIIFQGIWYLTVDQWDGFRTERKELLQALSGVENLVVLTGDIHAFYAGELHVDFDAPGAKPIGVEYVCAGISSSPFQEIVANQVLALDADGKFGLKELAQDVTKFDAALTTANPHYKHIDSFAHGIAIVDVNADKDIQVTFMKVADVKSKAFDGKVTKTVYKTTAGSNKVEKA